MERESIHDYVHPGLMQDDVHIDYTHCWGEKHCSSWYMQLRHYYYWGDCQQCGKESKNLSYYTGICRACQKKRTKELKRRAQKVKRHFAKSSKVISVGEYSIRIAKVVKCNCEHCKKRVYT